MVLLLGKPENFASKRIPGHKHPTPPPGTKPTASRLHGLPLSSSFGIGQLFYGFPELKKKEEEKAKLTTGHREQNRCCKVSGSALSPLGRDSAFPCQLKRGGSAPPPFQANDALRFGIAAEAKLPEPVPHRPNQKEGGWERGTAGAAQPLTSFLVTIPTTFPSWVTKARCRFSISKRLWACRRRKEKKRKTLNAPSLLWNNGHQLVIRGPPEVRKKILVVRRKIFTFLHFFFFKKKLH